MYKKFLDAPAHVLDKVLQQRAHQKGAKIA